MKTRVLLIICMAIFCSGGIAQKKEVIYGALQKTIRQDPSIKKFRENRFGQFIHWGIFAIPAGEWNNKIYPSACEFLPKSANITPQEWRKFAKDFNPTDYDAKKWAKLAKEMGVKYATITTKHHDGFCLWPSKYSDFDMESTPFKRDLIKEFVDAYNAEGIDVYLYYSILDWDHKDWRYDLKNKQDTIAFNDYKEFARNQLLELIDINPTIKGFWFDGTWDGAWKKNGIFSYELEKELKEKSPGLIINSRFRADEHGARHFDSNGVLMGDYESGYERRLPHPDDKVVPTRDWEAVMTIPENLWGYHKAWDGYIKTDMQLIEMLVRCVALNGNFLLNFGPTASGDFRKEELTVMKEIGKWISQYGNAIYGCGYAGLERQDWGYYTAKQNTNIINLVVFNPPINGRIRVKLDKKYRLTNALEISNNKSLSILPSVNGEFFIEISKIKKNQPFVIQAEIIGAKDNINHYMPPLI